MKPQFEAGRVEASRGSGVVRDATVWRRVLGEVRDAIGGLDAAMMGIMVSPITGANGNVEFLAHFHRGAPEATVRDQDLDDVVDAVGGGS